MLRLSLLLIFSCLRDFCRTCNSDSLHRNRAELRTLGRARRYQSRFRKLLAARSSERSACFFAVACWGGCDCRNKYTSEWGLVNCGIMAAGWTHFATGQAEISKVHFFGSTVTVGVAQIFVQVPRGHSLTVTVAVGVTWGLAADTLRRSSVSQSRF